MLFFVTVIQFNFFPTSTVLFNHDIWVSAWVRITSCDSQPSVSGYCLMSLRRNFSRYRKSINGFIKDVFRNVDVFWDEVKNILKKVKLQWQLNEKKQQSGNKCFIIRQKWKYTERRKLFCLKRTKHFFLT